MTLIIALIAKGLSLLGVGLKSEQIARIVFWAGLFTVLSLTAFCGYRAYQNRKEDKARQAIAEAVTKGIQSGAREKEIERTIENVAIREGASLEEVEAAKKAVKEAKENKKENVTAEDISKQLEGLGL